MPHWARAEVSQVLEYERESVAACRGSRKIPLFHQEPAALEALMWGSQPPGTETPNP